MDAETIATRKKTPGLAKKQALRTTQPVRKHSMEGTLEESI